MPPNNTPYIAALDFGAKRVGVALAHSESALPSPHSTLANDDNFWENLQQLIETEQVGTLVVGLPRGLDGQETAQTAVARAFAAELAHKTGLPVHLQDEAGTSVQAEAELRGSKKGYNKGQVDALAAAIILQDYLVSNKEGRL
jgi:putative Holliday junction resolvase